MIRLVKLLIHPLRQLVQLAWQELRHITADSGLLLFFLVVPFAYPFLYAALYGRETIKEAPLVVVDKDHSALSRRFVHMVNASPDVAVVAQRPSEAEAYPLIDSEQAYALLVIPEHFATKLAQGQQAEVDLHTHFNAAMYYKAYALTTTDVALSLGRELAAERAPAASTKATAIQVRPIESEWVTAYNPQGGMQGFLLPGVLVLIIQQTLLLGLSMRVGTQREGQALRLQQGAKATPQASALTQLLGQGLCYLLLYTLTSCFTLLLAPRLFGLPQLTELGTYLLFLLPLLLAVIAFSQCLSQLVKDRELGMLLWVFTSVPFLFLSGLSWPMSAFPPALKALAYLLPSTPGVQGFVALSSMGASLHELQTPYLVLWAQAIVYLCLAVLLKSYGARRAAKGV